MKKFNALPKLFIICLTNGNDSWNVSGLDRFEARKKLWSDLEETGLAVKKEPHTLRVPRSQRGGEVRKYEFHMPFCNFDD